MVIYFKPMNKTTKIIIGAIIVVMLSAGLFAFIVGRTPKVIVDETGGNGGFPNTGEVSSRSSSSEKSFSLIKNGDDTKNILTQLTTDAVSGSAYYGTTTALYMERATGNLYKINLDGTEKTRLSNTTIPKIFETLWSYKSDKIMARYFEDATQDEIKLNVKTFLAPIGQMLKATSTSGMELKGVALPPTASEVAVSPAEDKIFYLSATEDGLTEGVVADFSNKNQKKIFELPFGEFNASWSTKDNIALLTKSSFGEKGFLYFLNSKTGALVKILGDINGLTAVVSLDGDKVVFSGIGRQGLESKIYNIKTGAFSDLGFLTLADKCVWGKKNKMPTGRTLYCAVPLGALGAKQPDDWYKGKVSFSDELWSKNISTGENKIILDSFGADIMNISANADDGYLVFTNKNDGTLWSLKLH